MTPEIRKARGGILKRLICWIFDVCPICAQSDLRFEPELHRCPVGFPGGFTKEELRIRNE